jgi:hypothetical protein
MDDALKRLVELDSRIWRLGLTQGQVDSWLDQFDGECEDASDERGLALYLLANLMFFGLAEIRILCASLFRDHYLRRATTEYRIAHGDTVDLGQIGAHVDNELQSTRFVGLGNPAESGTHLLYYFRTSNELELPLFCSATDLLYGTDPDPSTVRRVVLVDDLCGTGGTAIKVGDSLVPQIRTHLQDAGVSEPRVDYLTLFATEKGAEAVRESDHFDYVGTSMMLDETYRVLSDESRYLPSSDVALDISAAAKVLENYGGRVWRQHPLGFRNSQLLLGFAHNVPNNTLPVFWGESRDPGWHPILTRYAKRMTPRKVIES